LGRQLGRADGEEPRRPGERRHDNGAEEGARHDARELEVVVLCAKPLA